MTVFDIMLFTVIIFGNIENTFNLSDAVNRVHSKPRDCGVNTPRDPLVTRCTEDDKVHNRLTGREPSGSDCSVLGATGSEES